MHKRYIILISVISILVLSAGWFFALLLQGPAEDGLNELFTIEKGDGFQEIADRLVERRLIKSARAFKFYSLLTGSASRFKPGIYDIDRGTSVRQIINAFEKGPETEVRITIPEGMSVYEIDGLLARHAVIEKGSLIQLHENEPVEGMLFPDTYLFFREMSAEDVVDKLLTNFNIRTASIFGDMEPEDIYEVLILASILEREVPGQEDRRIVSGILMNRLDIGMALQVDATICYIKLISEPDEKCLPLSRSDFKIESLYNTYLHPGLPPGPIGNPGLDTIEAVLDPIDTEFLYYLNDTETGETYFSETFEEHEDKRAIYLR